MTAGKTLVKCHVQWCRHNRGKLCSRRSIVVSIVSISYPLPACCAVKAMSKAAGIAKKKEAE